MNAEPKRLNFSVNVTDVPHFAFRIGKWWIMLKPPGFPVLYSERHGGVKRFPLVLGWRITIRDTK